MKKSHLDSKVPPLPNVLETRHASESSTRLSASQSSGTVSSYSQLPIAKNGAQAPIIPSPPIPITPASISEPPAGDFSTSSQQQSVDPLLLQSIPLGLVMKGNHGNNSQMPPSSSRQPNTGGPHWSTPSPVSFPTWVLYHASRLS